MTYKSSLTFTRSSLDGFWPNCACTYATPSPLEMRAQTRRRADVLFRMRQSILANMSIRPVKRILKPKPTLEGAGVKLQRAFGFGDPKEFDPFLLFDDF